MTINRGKPMSDAPSVLVRVYLRPSTFQGVHAHARRLNLTEGELLSRLADRAVGSRDAD